MDTTIEMKMAKIAQLAKQGGVMKLKEMVSTENLSGNDLEMREQREEGK